MNMADGLAVSVLDLVGMRSGEGAGPAIARSVDLAQHAELWGYTRFWLAEHHSIEGLGCSATAVLIGHVAGRTSTIRVGSGGIMLPNHAPLVVAEQFGTLEALYPGRIDLGLGRAPGGDFATMRALRRDSRQSGDDFPDLLEELRTYLGDARPGQAVKAIPGQGSHVPITLLGSSDFSAQLAGGLDGRVVDGMGTGGGRKPAGGSDCGLERDCQGRTGEAGAGDRRFGGDRGYRHVYARGPAGIVPAGGGGCSRDSSECSHDRWGMKPLTFHGLDCAPLGRGAQSCSTGSCKIA